jgi:hypothetical protein
MTIFIQSNDLSENPAIQSVWYDVDTDAINRALSGVGVLTGCAPTAQGSPDMTVAIAAGTVQATAGGVPVTVSGGNVTIGAAHASLPRLDVITSSSAGVKTVTAGTAAASPKPPALPAGDIYIAMIYIPATVTQITTARIQDKRFVLHGPESAVGCMVSGTSKGLTSGAFVSLAFEAADTYDPDAFHDPSSNNHLMTVPAGRGGKYALKIRTSWPSSGSANTDRRIAYRINGGTDIILERMNYSITSAVAYGTGTVDLVLAAGDTVEARQWTGIASTTTNDYNASLIRVGT